MIQTLSQQLEIFSKIVTSIEDTLSGNLFQLVFSGAKAAVGLSVFYILVAIHIRTEEQLGKNAQEMARV